MARPAVESKMAIRRIRLCAAFGKERAMLGDCEYVILYAVFMTGFLP
jgi:hypothetical protein